MARYYFDLHDGELISDEEGVELRDLVAVQAEAARALAGLTWDRVAGFHGPQLQEMAIAVRDADGPVMKVEFAFKIIRRQ